MHEGTKVLEFWAVVRSYMLVYFFFFQAEDGIRDYKVTGVQTCALPIYLGAANLLGYLIGALAAAPLAERLGALRVLLWCWVALALSFAACAWPLPMP